MKAYRIFFPLILLALSCSQMIDEGIQSMEDPRVPEINIKVGDESILSQTGSYEINNVAVNSSSAAIIFTIENTGTADLVLNGPERVQVIDDINSEFSIGQPSSSVLAAGTNMTFTMVFSPVILGDRSVTVTVNNNDFDESAYSFTVTGRTRPQPDFSARLRNGGEPLTVTFEDRSLPAGDITAWAWDFNGDGTVDSTSQNPAYTYTKAGTYSVILTVTGSGGENFRVKAGYITVNKPDKTVVTDTLDSINMIALGDLSGDGLNDIAAVSYTGDTVVWFKNNGDGTFVQYDVAVSFDGPNAVGIADFDGDGDMDITSGKYFNSVFSWWENDDITADPGSGNGSSWTEHSVWTISHIRFLMPFDMDGDGDTDILASQSGATTNYIYWFENDGAGTFTVHTVGYGTPSIGMVYPADIDNDGDIDVAEITSTPYSSTLLWWENHGSDTWAQHEIKTGMIFGASVCAADFNGDGDMDIAVTDNYENTVYWFENGDVGAPGSGNGTIWDENILETDISGPEGIMQVDYDNDGDSDILVAMENADQVALYKNDGSGNFTKFDIDNNFDGAEYVCVGDMTGDGVNNIVASSFYNDVIAYWSYSDMWPSRAVTDVSFVGVASIHATDFDLDGDIDVLGAAKSDGDLAWWKNNGEGIFTKEMIANDFDAVSSVTAADLDSDGDMDVIAGALPGAAWFENNGGVYTRHDLTGDYVNDVHCADLNGDGLPDVVAALNYYHKKIVWYKNNGGGSFASADTVSTAVYNTLSVTSADMDGDGDLDLVCSASDFSGCVINVCWFRNNTGTGSSWTLVTVDTALEGASSVYPADIDGDGDTDIVAAAITDNCVVWYDNIDQNTGQGDGNGSSFARNTVQSGFTGETSIMSAVNTTDIDGDGDIDIMGAASGDNIISLWRNEGGGTFGPMESIYTDFTGACDVLAADMDNDGDPDIVGAAYTDDDIMWWENNIIEYGN